jgi:tRNA(Ile)-lysidine synthase TilS/MesJ
MPLPKDEVAKLEAMDISEGGKLVGLCRLHLRDFMKRQTKPIAATELLHALDKEADAFDIPLGRGSGTRRESYKAALTSELSQRHIETYIDDYTMVWHEYADPKRHKRGHIRD